MYDPATLGPIGDDVVAMYERAEILLISIIRDALLRTGEEPAWDAEQLLAIRQERHRVEGVMGTLHQQLPDMVMQSTDAAYLRGTLEAEKELAEGAKVGMFQAAPGSTPVNHAAVVAIASDTVQRMGKVHPPILRRVEDAFRTIVKEAAGYSVTGALTTRQAQQRAFTRMARDGMGFFVDQAGRKWGLDTYADMSVRTATTRALLAGHTDTMVANGVDLVVVSSHPRPAPVCAPFERKVLSLTGKFPKGRNAINDQIFNVVATMAEAEAAGLHHPNCRHTHSAFVPGFTDLTPPKMDEDHEGYKATQKQRYLERQVRASKKMEAAALSEEAKLKARQRTRTYQARIRDHVKKHNLPRYRHREQVAKPLTGTSGLPQEELKRKADVLNLDTD